MAATTVVQQKNSVIQGNGAEPNTRYWLSSKAEPASLVELETASTVLNIRGNHGGFQILLARTRGGSIHTNNCTNGSNHRQNCTGGTQAKSLPPPSRTCPRDHNESSKKDRGGVLVVEDIQVGCVPAGGRDTREKTEFRQV